MLPVIRSVEGAAREHRQYSDWSILA